MPCLEDLVSGNRSLRTFTYLHRNGVFTEIQVPLGLPGSHRDLNLSSA